MSDGTAMTRAQRSPANPQELEERLAQIPLNPRAGKPAPLTSRSLTATCQSISAVTQSVVPCHHSPSVTESRLVLLTTQQAKNQGDNLLGARNNDFIWKDSSQRTWQTSVPENHLS